MKFYHITDEPIKIYGLAHINKEERQYWKIPQSVMDEFPQYNYLGKRTVGGRVRFQTNSKMMTVKMTLAETKEDINIPLSGSAGADIYLGSGESSKFIGYIAPNVHMKEEISVEKEFKLSGKMEIVTINLPRNDHLLSMEIGIEENAEIIAAPNYTYEGPIVFYGSSITEGGCAPRCGNAYTSMVCRWLDSDYRNLGFSGSAKGEIGMASYINTIENMSLLVMDYDHNAPTAEHLEETHEAFFKEIRKAHPKLPVLFISRPDTDKDIPDSIKRRDIVKATYEHAKEQGDNNVWFIDGFTLFGKFGRDECTIDGTHPNTLGYMRMSEKIYPVIKEILENVSRETFFHKIVAR